MIAAKKVRFVEQNPLFFGSGTIKNIVNYLLVSFPILNCHILSKFSSLSLFHQSSLTGAITARIHI